MSVLWQCENAAMFCICVCYLLYFNGTCIIARIYVCSDGTKANIMYVCIGYKVNAVTCTKQNVDTLA